MIETLNTLPKTPGIYQYFDSQGKLLYVGKAKNLFNRVRSYFSFTPHLHAKANLSARIQKMIGETQSMEYIIVDSEHDALILENSLIKQLNPKYNILLRDDKTYPYIVLDKSESFPRFEITRKVHPAKSLEYYGPFTIGARDILDSLYELFPLVQKKSCAQGTQACLYYQIHKCLAPCEKKVTVETYAKIVDEAKDHILNKEKLMKLLKEKMLSLAEELRFEEANILKERLLSIEKSTHKTAIDLARTHNYDIFALAADEKQIVIVKMFMREGRIVSSSYIHRTIKEAFEKDEIYTRAIVDFYTSNETIIPKEILIYDTLNVQETLESLENTLTIHAHHKVSIITPQRGDKLKIVELAHKNALELLKKERKENQDHIKVLEGIQDLFGLDNLPETIEVFDNSHLQGVAKVGGMIAYHHGAYNKKHYRHYHLQAHDEYGQMRETLLKRIESFQKVSPPDLWILDGGKALLDLAKSLLDQAHISIDLLAIAKEKVDAKAHRAKGSAKDLIWNHLECYRLQPSDSRLHFIQKLRDEAHRFAITFHKKVKLKHDKQSDLLSLTGIGPAKVKKLLNYFGSFDAIKSASFEELRSIINDKDAKLIENFYN